MYPSGFNFFFLQYWLHFIFTLFVNRNKVFFEYLPYPFPRKFGYEYIFHSAIMYMLSLDIDITFQDSLLYKQHTRFIFHQKHDSFKILNKGFLHKRKKINMHWIVWLGLFIVGVLCGVAILLMTLVLCATYCPNTFM